MRSGAKLKKLLIFFLLYTIDISAKQIVFKDFGVIWVCDGDFWIYAERNRTNIKLSSDTRGIDTYLYYDKINEKYFSKDKRHSIYYEGDNLEADRIELLIDGKKYSCFYEYIENG